MWWEKFWQIFSLILYTMNFVLAIYASIVLIFKRQDPVKTLSWVVVMILLPYIGIILYAFFGQNWRKDKLFNRKGAGDEKARKALGAEMLEHLDKPGYLPPSLIPFKKLIAQNLRTSHSLLGVNENIEIYFSGKEALSQMYNSILMAKKHIHLQSYIIENDFTGQKFKDLLIRKAKEGLEVRVMYDSVGCWNLDREYLEEMKRYGIEVMSFSPVHFLLPTTKMNYRNHRKILVVDGTIGFLGGVNIAQRYYDGGPFSQWRDTHIKVEGEGVYSLQSTFLLDRYFVKNKNLRKRKQYYPDFKMDIPAALPDQNRYYTQVISSGPDSDWSGIMQCYFTAITQAKDHIYIITPYFTPSETILNAIKITSLAGVKVYLMLPERSDTRLTHWGTMSYISELLAARVNILLFKSGFNHSKVLSIDGEFCIIGSANMDNRSFEHNFEITSVIYNKECAQIIESQFNKDRCLCHQVTRVGWKRRPKRNRVFESIARLGSPLL